LGDVRCVVWVAHRAKFSLLIDSCRFPKESEWCMVVIRFPLSVQLLRPSGNENKCVLGGNPGLPDSAALLRFADYTSKCRACYSWPNYLREGDFQQLSRMLWGHEDSVAGHELAAASAKLRCYTVTTGCSRGGSSSPCWIHCGRGFQWRRKGRDACAADDRADRSLSGGKAEAVSPRRHLLRAP
jgi:hypothetical protein